VTAVQGGSRKELYRAAPHRWMGHLLQGVEDVFNDVTEWGRSCMCIGLMKEDA
jgi:hypothetical protein